MGHGGVTGLTEPIMGGKWSHVSGFLLFFDLIVGIVRIYRVRTPPKPIPRYIGSKYGTLRCSAHEAPFYVVIGILPSPQHFLLVSGVRQRDGNTLH